MTELNKIYGLETQNLTDEFVSAHDCGDYPFKGEEYDLQLVKFAFDWLSSYIACITRDCDACEGTGRVQIAPESEVYHPCDTCRPIECEVWMDGYNAPREEIEGLEEAFRTHDEKGYSMLGANDEDAIFKAARAYLKLQGGES